MQDVFLRYIIVYNVNNLSFFVVILKVKQIHNSGIMVKRSKNDVINGSLFTMYFVLFGQSISFSVGRKPNINFRLHYLYLAYCLTLLKLKWKDVNSMFRVISSFPQSLGQKVSVYL